MDLVLIGSGLVVECDSDVLRLFTKQTSAHFEEYYVGSSEPTVLRPAQINTFRVTYYK